MVLIASVPGHCLSFTLYTVTLVYGTKSLCDPRVLLSFDRTMGSRPISTELCLILNRRDVPVGVPFDLSTPTGMSCIGTYGENCKSDNVSKYRVLLVAFLLLWHEN